MTHLKIYRCYNTNILINKPTSNIKEILLKSIEMPLLFNNIRNANNSNSLSLSVWYNDPFHKLLGCNFYK